MVASGLMSAFGLTALEVVQVSEFLEVREVRGAATAYQQAFLPMLRDDNTRFHICDLVKSAVEAER